MQTTRPQKDDSSLVEEVPNLFKRFSLLELSWEKKSATVEQIINEINDIGIAYWSQMILSVVIATFGLMIDATAVVIWAMLIAPILSPLEWIAFATTTGNKKIFLKSFRLLFLSVLLGILVAVLFTLIIPSFQLSTEILSRTQPTLIDLWIALASWVIAFLSFGYERIQWSLAWVAMAAALVPPISVVGIGIGLLRMDIAWGSFLLFITNLVAIILMGVVIFYLFGFYPKQKDDQQRSLRNMVWALGLLFLLCIPLAGSLRDITSDLQDTQLIQQTINQYLSLESPDTKLNQFTYENWTLDIALTSQAENLFTEPQKEALITSIAEKLNTSIQADVSITPVYTATPLDRLQPTLEEKTLVSVDNFLENSYPFVTLLDLEIAPNRKALLLDMRSSEVFDTVRCRTKLNEHLVAEWFSFETVLIQRQQSPTAVNNLDQRTRTIQWLFSESISDALLQSLEVFEVWQTGALELTLWISTSLDQPKLSLQLADYIQRLEEVFEVWVTIIPKVQFFEEIEG